MGEPIPERLVIETSSLTLLHKRQRSGLLATVAFALFILPAVGMMLAGGLFGVARPTGWGAMAGASWIWNVAGSTTSTPAGTIFLRRTFDVADPAAVASAVLRLNADDGHTTYVNGTQVSTSSGANNAWQTSQITDITSLLVPGTNVIATAAANSGSAGGLLAVLQVDKK